MPRMVVSIDGVVIKEVPITKERTTVGRRPYNDIVIDNLAVSGEHAVFVLQGADVSVQDLGSTNGTYVNGKAVKNQHALDNGDTVEMGKYKIRFMAQDAPDYEKTMLFTPGMVPPPLRPAAPTHTPVHTPLADLVAQVRVVTGPAAGREVALNKVVTTIGKPGVAVASITKRHHGFVLAHVEGEMPPQLNGVALGSEPVPLKNGDRIALAGTEMEFVQG